MLSQFARLRALLPQMAQASCLAASIGHSRFLLESHWLKPFSISEAQVFRRRPTTFVHFTVLFRNLLAPRARFSPRCSSNFTRQESSPSVESLAARAVNTSISRTRPAYLRTGITARSNQRPLRLRSSCRAQTVASTRRVFVRIS